MKPRSTISPKKLLEPDLPRSLKLQAVSGLAWMVSQSVLTKLLSVFGQIALAYLLLPEHFASISLAYTVSTFARVLQSGGVREVLVYQEKRFEELSNAALWLSLTLGACSTLVIVFCAPLAQQIYQSEEVYSLLMWIAIQPIIEALSSVPSAQLQREHKFRILAGFAALRGCTQTVSTVLFAWFGFGAFSFVFGSLCASLANMTAVWVARPCRVFADFSFTKWPALWKGTASLVLVGLATTLVQQVDYVMLGIFQPKIEVGYYFFAFGIASQATHLLMQNISTVFLPLLCKIQSDKRRQLTASLSAFHILAGIGLPVSFLQCGLIDSSFHLFLPGKWLPAIPVSEILSLGLGLNVLSSLCWSLLKSQGRFKTIAVVNWIGAIPFSLAIATASAYGSTESVGWVVTAWCAAYSPVILWLSIRNIGGSWRQVGSIFGTPTVASLMALLAAWQAESLISDVAWIYVARMLTVIFVFSFVYLAALLVTKHPLVDEFSRLILRRDRAA